MAPVAQLDTTEAARRVQRGILNRMSPEQRVRLAAEMSDDVREVAMAGIRILHPGWSEKRVRRALLVRIYGAKLVERAWGPEARS